MNVIIVLYCAITYWLGGQTLPYFNRGYKWIRRYALPIGLLIYLITQGNSVPQSIIACVGLSIALHIGYGDKIAMYALTGLLMGIPAAVLYPSFSWLIFLPCAVHTFFGYLSLRINKFGWAYVALLTGASIGIAYIGV